MIRILAHFDEVTNLFIGSLNDLNRVVVGHNRPVARN